MIPNLLNFFQPYLGAMKLAVVTLILSAGIGAYLVHKQQISSLESTVTMLQQEKGMLIANNLILKNNNQVLVSNIESLKSANVTNSVTIQKLIEERSDAQEAINNLASLKAKDKKTIAALNKRLSDMLKDPKNDGILSPALRETIRDIQNNRGQK